MPAINPTPKVNSQYGAPMGRPGYGHGADPMVPFSLQRIPLNNGGYDRGGAYWGTGQPLYWYCSYETGTESYGCCEFCNLSTRFALNRECTESSDGNHVLPQRECEVEISDYIRANSREHAKDIIRAKYPHAGFKR